MSNLYELCNTLQNAIDFAEENPEVDLIDMISDLGLHIDEKVENIALYIKRLKNEVEQWKFEELRIAEERKRKEARIDSLSQYLAFCMGKGKFESPRVNITAHVDRSVQYTTKALSVIPVEYQREKTIMELDTTAVKTALDNGSELTFAKYVERKRIK